MKMDKKISKLLFRTMIFAIVFIMIFISVASLFYIFSETKHECSGENCPVCACIHQAQQALRNLSSGAAAGQLMTAVFISLFAAFAVHFFVISCDSPVKRRVRLNN